MDHTLLRRQLAPAAQKRAALEESPKNTKEQNATASSSSKEGKNVAHTQTSGYQKTTNLKKVNWLVMNIVNENLADAWAVNNSHQMCFIFDLVNPAHWFAQDMHYDEDIQFLDADPRGGNVTETDMNDGIGLMPICSIRVKCVFFVCHPRCISHIYMHSAL